MNTKAYPSVVNMAEMYVVVVAHGAFNVTHWLMHDSYVLGLDVKAVNLVNGVQQELRTVRV
jgi:hypothetical protein